MHTRKTTGIRFKIPKRTIHGFLGAGALTLAAIAGVAKYEGARPEQNPTSTAAIEQAQLPVESPLEQRVFESTPIEQQLVPQDPVLPDLAREDAYEPAQGPRYLVLAARSSEAAAQNVAYVASKAFHKEMFVFTVKAGEQQYWKVATRSPAAYADEHMLLRKIVSHGVGGQGPFWDAYPAVHNERGLVQITAKDIQRDVLGHCDPDADVRGYDAVLAAQLVKESRWSHGQVSHKGATGIRQVMPDTAADQDRWSRKNCEGFESITPASASQWKRMLGNPTLNMHIGTVTLVDYTRMFDGSLKKGVMAYNAGPGPVLSGKVYKFRETMDYINTIWPKACARYPAIGGCESISTSAGSR